MYYIVEIFSSKRSRTVEEDEDLDHARMLAYIHSFRTGLEVEVQNEMGKILDRLIAWRE